jgi:hypothetical protein
MTRKELHELLLDCGLLVNQAAEDGRFPPEFCKSVKSRLQAACMGLADVWPKSGPSDEWGSFS